MFCILRCEVVLLLYCLPFLSISIIFQSGSPTSDKTFFFAIAVPMSLPAGIPSSMICFLMDIIFGFLIALGMPYVLRSSHGFFVFCLPSH